MKRSTAESYKNSRKCGDRTPFQLSLGRIKAVGIERGRDIPVYGVRDRGGVLWVLETGAQAAKQQKKKKKAKIIV